MVDTWIYFKTNSLANTYCHKYLEILLLVRVEKRSPLHLIFCVCVFTEVVNYKRDRTESPCISTKPLHVFQYGLWLLLRRRQLLPLDRTCSFSEGVLRCSSTSSSCISLFCLVFLMRSFYPSLFMDFY